MRWMAYKRRIFLSGAPHPPPSLNEGVALTRALDQPKSPDEPTVVQTTTLTKPYTIHMRKTNPVYQLVEKNGLDCLIHVPSGAETNVPEQHATWFPESNFDLTTAVSGSNESPNQTQHNAHAYYSPRVPTCWENTAWLSNLCPVRCRSQSTWAKRDMAHRVQFWSDNSG